MYLAIIHVHYISLNNDKAECMRVHTWMHVDAHGATGMLYVCRLVCICAL